MKAAILSEPKGIDFLQIRDVQDEPKREGQLKIKVKLAGLNPVDVNLMSGNIRYNIWPIPHIPGVELYGELMDDGKKLHKGDRVIVFPRLFDGVCRYCLTGNEEVCENGGLFGVSANGAYREFANVEEKYIFRVPDSISDETAVSLPVGGLTAMHALNVAGASHGKRVLVYGASGNTGIFSVMISSLIGADVHAVSRKPWITDFGARQVFEPGKIPSGYMYDVVVNPLGSLGFEESLDHLDKNGKFVTFGTLGGNRIEADIGKIYTRQLGILGSTGGSRKELSDLLVLLDGYKKNIPVEKVFSLDQIKDALKSFQGRNKGRIIIKVSS